MIANVTSYREGDEGFWTIASADGRRQLARPARLPDVPPPYALSGQQTLGLTRAKNPAENRSIREMFAFLERGGGEEVLCPPIEGMLRRAPSDFCQGL